jgi:hypothetical protein
MNLKRAEKYLLFMDTKGRRSLREMEEIIL